MSEQQGVEAPEVPDENDIPKTSDQLDESDQRLDASAQEEEQASADERDDDDTVEDAEAADTTLGGVAGQAGVGNG